LPERDYRGLIAQVTNNNKKIARYYPLETVISKKYGNKKADNSSIDFSKTGL
jgi:hypothetical protein